MKKTLLYSLIGILIGAGITYTVMNTDSPSEQATLGSSLIQRNCELSDGKFINNRCECPFDEENNQTADQMYNKSSGYCISDIGDPAGDAFYASAGLPYGPNEFWRPIMATLCSDSGGYNSGHACLCPDDKSLDKSSGRCI